jgi:cytoskeletal protein RodZ
MVRAGERLREERLRRKLTLQDAEKAIRIKASFLAAIERGDYGKLPSSAYAQGFVRNYAEFLGLPIRQILAVFRREFDERKDYKVLPESLSGNESLAGRHFRVRRRILFIAALLILAIGFMLYQFRFAVLNPPLTVESPKESSIASQQISVAGSTEPNATVSVNGQPATLDQQGKFTKTVAAFDGPLTIIVKAKSRFGKETTVERHVEVKSQ